MSLSVIISQSLNFLLFCSSYKIYLFAIEIVGVQLDNFLDHWHQQRILDIVHCCYFHSLYNILRGL